MNITITINTDNAVFEDDPGFEVARILQTIAARFKSQYSIIPVFEEGEWYVRDDNGNKVGSIIITE